MLQHYCAWRCTLLFINIIIIIIIFITIFIIIIFINITFNIIAIFYFLLLFVFPFTFLWLYRCLIAERKAKKNKAPLTDRLMAQALALQVE